MDSFRFSIKSRKCQEPPRTDKSQTPTNADLQSTYYSTLSTKLDTPRRTLPTIRGRRCSRRMAHSDYHVFGMLLGFFSDDFFSDGVGTAMGPSVLGIPSSTAYIALYSRIGINLAVISYVISPPPSGLHFL